MKRPEDPLRLFEDPNVPAPVAEAVRAARGPAPEPARLAEIALALGLPAPLPLVPPAATSAAGVAKAALTKGALTKVVVTTLAAATLAGTVAVVAVVGPGARHRAPVAVVGTPSPRAPEPVLQEDDIVVAPVDPPAPSSPAPAVSSSRRRHAHAPVAPAVVEAPPDAVSRLREEAALVQRAERLLATDPASALRLTEERRRRFPDGALDQEAEVVAIDALLRLGRRPEATARAQAFESTHAASLHARRIHRLLD
jgi:hypothetical protein